MAINLTTKVVPYTDEVFAKESKKSLLTNSDFDWVGAHTIKVYKISTVGMNDYNRSGADDNNWSRYGAVAGLDATTEEMTLKKDRSFTFAIDKLDEDETLQQLAAALVGQLRPAAVVCVDSLCSAEGQRLGRTVQFSDSGLYPAQADHTRHLTRDTLGVPVVAAGIPTLMQAQEGADLVVTPRALDSVIAHGAALLAGSVNRALQPRLTVQQLCWLTG